MNKEGVEYGKEWKCESERDSVKIDFFSMFLSYAQNACFVNGASAIQKYEYKYKTEKTEPTIQLEQKKEWKLWNAKRLVARRYGRARATDAEKLTNKMGRRRKEENRKCKIEDEWAGGRGKQRAKWKVTMRTQIQSSELLKINTSRRAMRHLTESEKKKKKHAKWEEKSSRSTNIFVNKSAGTKQCKREGEK